MSTELPTPPQDAETIEARLRRFALPLPPAALDARVAALRTDEEADKEAEAAEAALRRFMPAAPSAALDARIAEALSAAPFEAALLRYAPAAPSAALDARIEALLAEPAVRLADQPAALPATLASHRSRAFWRTAGTAAAALAAGVALTVLLRPAIAPTNPPARPGVPATAKTDAPESVAMMPGVLESAYPAPVRAPAFEYAVPVGYEYQGSQTVYTRETPVGTVTDDSGAPMRAIRRDTLERHLYCDPKTRETIEVDTPREDMVLENLPSY